MASSTELFNAVASSTSDLIYESMPLLYIIIGGILAIGAGIILWRAFAFAFKAIK